MVWWNSFEGKLSEILGNDLGFLWSNRPPYKKTSSLSKSISDYEINAKSEDSQSRSGGSLPMRGWERVRLFRTGRSFASDGRASS